MDKKITYVYIWWILISLQFIGLMIEVLFKNLSTFWLIFGSIVLVYGMYLPMGDKEVYKYINKNKK